MMMLLAKIDTIHTLGSLVPLRRGSRRVRRREMRVRLPCPVLAVWLLVVSATSAWAASLAQWVNMGSNTGLFGYDWKAANVSGLNLAGSPQSMRRDFDKLKAHRAEIADGAFVVFTLCPFTSVLPESYDKTPSGKTHPLLSFDGTPPAATFTRSRDELIACWKRQFAIVDFADPMTERNRAAFAGMVAFARTAIAWCRAERLRPVFVYPPMAKCFDGVFPESFFKAYVLDFARDAAPDVPFFDYRMTPELRDDANFANALFLNRTGRARLTERTMRDILK